MRAVVPRAVGDEAHGRPPEVARDPRVHPSRTRQARGASATEVPPRDRLLPAVSRLVSDAVESLAHVDALLALRRAAPGPCTLATIAEAARVPDGVVARRCVEDLVAAGLVTPLGDCAAYRYAPGTAELRAAVDALAAAYHARRLLVLRALHSRSVVRRPVGQAPHARSRDRGTGAGPRVPGPTP